MIMVLEEYKMECSLAIVLIAVGFGIGYAIKELIIEAPT